MITGFYAGLLALVYIALIFNVIAKRLKFGIGLGSAENHILDKAVRVHGNFAEHVPFALLLMALCDYNGTDPIYLHAMGIVLVIARILHAYGLTKTSVRSFGRSVGVVGTALVIIVAAILLILQYVTA